LQYAPHFTKYVVLCQLPIPDKLEKKHSKLDWKNVLYLSEYIKVHYVRYADDFLVLVNGNKELASTLKAEIGEFLRDKLRLELSEEKTLITHVSSENIRFLGYEIGKSHEDSAITTDSIGRKKRTVNGTIQLMRLRNTGRKFRNG
jgi:hypothetical protein